jgi:CubicO group peptidase (beta-lactamase class C family)
MLRATGGGVAAAAIVRVDARSARADTAKPADPLFRALDEKIEAAMARYHVPGVAVGVIHDGREYVRGYGITNVDYPLPVDGDTLFSHRLDHEDVYGHGGHAAGRGGEARFERAGAPLSA